MSLTARVWRVSRVWKVGNMPNRHTVVFTKKNLAADALTTTEKSLPYYIASLSSSVVCALGLYHFSIECK